MFDGVGPRQALFCTVAAIMLATVPVHTATSGWRAAALDPPPAALDPPPATLDVPAAFPTIQAAIDAAHTGDTIRVAAGVYREHLVWSVKAIRLVGAGAEVTIVDGQDTGPCLVMTGVPEGAWIEGLTFTRGRAISAAQIGGGLYLERAHPTITRTIIRGNHAATGGGVAILDSNPLLLDNQILDNVATSFGGGINVTLGAPVFVGNTIDGNVSGRTAGGVRIQGGPGPTFINNTITRNRSADPAGGAGLFLWWTAARIVNTTVAGNHGGGVCEYFGQQEPAEIVNAVIWGNDGPSGEPAGYDLTSTMGQFTIRHSIVGLGTAWDARISHEFPGNLAIDPAFVDLAAGDVHLRGTSPAIDAGTAELVDLPETDKDGRPRVAGLAIDMGAYEADGVLPDPTPPVIVPVVEGTAGADDWYVNDVVLTWEVSDPESPITARSGCESQVVDYDTGGLTFTCTATSAGGTASVPVTIKRDATPPRFTACAVNPTVLWPPNRQMVPVSAAVRADDLSGVTVALESATSSEPDRGPQRGDPPDDIQGFVPGTLATTGFLRAERLGAAGGRVYTLVYGARDGAGNAGAPCRVTVTVPLNEKK